MARGRTCRGSAKSATPKVSKKKVSIIVRADQAQSVVVVGDFNQWDKTGIPLRKSPNGEWRVDLSLDPGEYQYRLKVDGQWQDHPEAQKRVPNPFGTENCVLVVQ